MATLLEITQLMHEVQQAAMKLRGDDPRRIALIRQYNDLVRKQLPPHIHDACELDIDELDLPPQIHNALVREGIRTCGDLLAAGERKVCVIKGFGTKRIDIIRERLADLGWELT
jgi:DNA-directed RNA polymerase alpha subunit